MKILFTADWHVHPRNHENTVPAMNFFAGYVEKNQPDLVIHGGDIFDTRGRLDPTSIAIARGFFERILNVCSIVVVPGNHDAANAWNEVDSATAVFSGMRSGPRREVFVCSQPSVQGLFSPAGKFVNIAVLPCPSKYHLLAAEGGAGGELSVVDLMGKIIQGLAVEAKKNASKGPVLFVFHGGVAGAEFESDRIIGVGQDVTLPTSVIAGPWDLTLAGHLHKAQDVAGVSYAGSLTQLNFAQAGYEPSFIEIEIRDKGVDTSPKGNGGGRLCSMKRIGIPVAQPFISVDVDMIKLREEALDEGELFPSITQVESRLKDYDRRRLAGARVRVKVRSTAEDLVYFDEEALKAQFTQVKAWKFVIERQAAVRIRSDAGVDTPLDDLLHEWAGMNKLEDIEGQMSQIAAQLDDEVDFKALGGSHYKPVVTTVENFKPFGKASIEWQKLPRITVIKGPNGSGKSLAARSEAFALFGMKALASPIRKVVRNGAQQATVIHVFEVSGTRYKIVRTVKLSPAGKATGDVSFSVEQDKPGEGGLYGWNSLNAADARETQKKIEQLVGSAEIFFATRFARQDEITKLLTQTPAARKNLLQEALQAGRFAAIEAAARQRAIKARKHVDQAKHEEGIYAEQADKLERWTEELAMIDKEIEGEADFEEHYQLGLERAREGQEDTVKANAELRAKGNRWVTIQGKINAKTLQRDEREKQVARLELALEDADRVGEKLEELQDIRDDWQKATEKDKRHTELEGDIKALEERIAGKVRAHRRQIETTENTITQKKRQTQILASVPCQNFGDDAGGRRDYHGEHYPTAETIAIVEEETGRCQFLQDAIAARDEIPPLEAGLEHLKKDEEHLEEPTKALQKKLQEQTGLGFDKGELGRLLTRLEALDEPALNKKAQEIAGATAKIETLQDELTAIHNELVALDEDAKANEVSAEALSKADTDEAAGRKKILELGNDLNEHRRKKEAKMQARGSQLQLVQSAKDAREKGAKIRAAIGPLHDDLQATEALIGAVGRDGIPFLVLERALPQLQDAMNALLDGSPLSVVIDPIREIESGKVRDEVAITYRDENGEQVLEDASGYQANLLGVALRAAIAELEADRAGVRPEFFVIDEGFGAYDPDNIPHGREMIHKLADRFGKVVFITHVPEVMEAAEGELRIRPTPEGSVIEEVLG